MDLITIINTVTPSFEDIREEVESLRNSHPNKSSEEICDLYVKRIRNKYTSIGVASALPSVIPGVGTATQIAVEAGSITADLGLMLRWMASVCYGTALIYERNIENEFNQEFVKILGIWCGAIISTKVAAEKIGTKVALAQFNKKVSGKVLQSINRKVGTTLLTKYGTKRGGIALGKLVPFGVGALVGGSFNFLTMQSFGKAARAYYITEEQEYFVIE